MAKMVCVGIGKMVLLLLSLSLLTDRGHGVLPKNDKLQNIMTTMFKSFNQQKLKQQIAAMNNKQLATGQQYSIALQLSNQECQRGVLDKFPTDLQNLRNTLAKGDVYDTGNIVAAIPRHTFINNEKKGTDHSEYLVLKKLLAKNQVKPGCLLVYTYFSPCFSKCLNNDNKANIVNLLNNLKNNNQNTDIMLVYSSVFHYDKNSNSKSDIYEKLKQIPVPVYCCNKTRNTVTCKMLDKNTNENQDCLSERN